MNRRIIAVVASLLAVGLLAAYWLVSRSRQSVDATLTMKTVPVYMGWLYSGAYGGEALGAQDFAATRGLKIEMHAGGPGLDPVRLTGPGAIGIAASDEVIRAIDKGAPLIIVGVLNNRSPAAFAVLESGGIKSPKDFAGKRVGVLPFGSTGIIYRAMIAAAGVSRASVTEVPVYPDLKPFIAGSTHDVQPVFAYDEPISLKAQGVAFRLIKPEDYGVRFKGAVYFAHRDTVRTSPEMITAFLAAMRDGWNRAFAAPDTAIAALQKLDPKLDASRERQVLDAAMEYYRNDSSLLFTTRPDSWSEMLKLMKEYGATSKELTPADILAVDFVKVNGK